MAAGAPSMGYQATPAVMVAPQELLSPTLAMGMPSTMAFEAPETMWCGPPLQEQATLSPSFARSMDWYLRSHNLSAYRLSLSLVPWLPMDGDFSDLLQQYKQYLTVLLWRFTFRIDQP